MAHYTKLWSHILNSTVWNEDDQTRLVWITMLALSDMGGYVAGSIPGLAHQARVSIQSCEKALIILESPDNYSRTKEHEGRRIKTVDGGWMILNYEKHREAAAEDLRRQQNRERARRFRENKRNANRNDVTRDVTQNNASSRQAEAEAEAEVLNKGARADKSNKKSSCAEPKTTIDTPSPDNPIKGDYPTAGKIKSWSLTQLRLNSYSELFPGLDVLQQLKIAKQWCVDNPKKQKTATGMPRFLTSWLSRANDRPTPMNGSSGGNGHASETASQARVRKLLNERE